MYPLIHVGSIVFYTFGLVLGLAICLGWTTFASYFRNHGIRVNEAVLGACIVSFGCLGAKLDSALLSALFSADPHHSFAALATDPQGGYTYFGSILLGTLAALVYARWNGLPLLRFADSLFCTGPAYAVGRIGCFLAGDGDYGVPTTLPWAVSFPHGIIPTTARVHPTMLYLSAWEFTLFAVLRHLSTARPKTPLPPGALLGCYLLASGAGRFFVEFLSRNPIVAFGLKESQWVSTAMMAGGAFVLLRLLLFRVQGRGPVYAPNAARHARPTSLTITSTH